MTTTTTIVTGRKRRPRTTAKVEPIYYLFLLPSLILFTLAITVPGAIGIFFNAFPKTAKKMVKKFYDRAYNKAVYCEQAYIEKVLAQLLKKDFQKIFRTRYIVASYDMYLRNGHQSPAAGIHTDLPNSHHVYETENDLSLSIPLVDLDDENGGR